MRHAAIVKVMLVAQGEDQLSAEELVARVAQGAPRAEDDFVRRFHKPLLMAVARMVDDPDAAHDVVNEALLIGLERARAAKIEIPEKVGGLLYGIAQNYYRADQRKRMRAQTTDPIDLDGITADHESPEEIVARSQAGRRVRQVVQQIGSPRYREALVRFYLREEDKATICAETDIEPGNLNQVLFRARQAYKRLVEREHAVVSDGEETGRG